MGWEAAALSHVQPPAEQQTGIAMESQAVVAVGSSWEAAAHRVAGSYPKAVPASAKGKPKGRPKKKSLFERLAVIPDAEQNQPPQCQPADALVPFSNGSVNALSSALQSSSFHQDLSPLQRGILIAQRMCSEDQEQNEDTSASSKFLKRVFAPVYHHASKSVMEELFDGRFTNQFMTAGSCVVESGSAHWFLFLQQCQKLIQEKKLQGILFVKQRMFDETPLRVRHSKKKRMKG